MHRSCQEEKQIDLINLIDLIILIKSQLVIRYCLDQLEQLEIK